MMVVLEGIDVQMMCYVEHLLVTNLFNCAENTIFLISFDFVRIVYIESRSTCKMSLSYYYLCMCIFLPER